MREIVDFIARVLDRPDDEGLLDKVRAEVETLCRRFPHYPARWSDRD
jgi:glycine/serine hydroxymethyltransferase